MSPEKFEKKKMDIVITLSEVDKNNYTIAAKKYPEEIQGDETFTLLEGIADIKFTPNSSPKDPEAIFSSEVEISITFPKEVKKKIKELAKVYKKLEGKKKKDLILAFYLNGTWVPFSNLSDLLDSEGKKKGKKVKFLKWYTDPPVGWGFL